MLITEAFRLNFTQGEVDFVIPQLDEDLPLCIDPFLLYKSRDDKLRTLHNQLLSLFDNAIGLFRENKRSEFQELIDFPEVNEIGFGYSEGAIRGSGLGRHLNGLLAETLAASEPLQERGIRHIEELQLVSIGVAADRVSDIAANALKRYLIEYTQEQAQLWDIPITSAVPAHHYFDFKSFEWQDGYFDLPRNPLTSLPLLLVPRRVVRLLPWINYDDYAATEFRMFLRSTTRSGWNRFPGTPRQTDKAADKPEVVEVTRNNLDLLVRYVTRKERESAEAQPVYVTKEDLGLPTRPMAEELIHRLSALPAGDVSATAYQRIAYEILNYLFEPELTDGEMEVRTVEGTERRDIIYTNESDISFWEYVRHNYGSPFVEFEVKNVQKLKIEYINQIANYLGARLGSLGFIVTRNSPPENIICKTYVVYNDSAGQPRKLILILSDEDLVWCIRSSVVNKWVLYANPFLRFEQESGFLSFRKPSNNVVNYGYTTLASMLRNRDSGQDPSPTRHIRRKYRDFRTRCQ